MPDGSLIATRWEYQERSWANIQSIWFVAPDGTQADALFKQHFNDPWALEEMRSMIPARPKRRARVKKLTKRAIEEAEGQV